MVGMKKKMVIMMMIRTIGVEYVFWGVVLGQSRQRDSKRDGRVHGHPRPRVLTRHGHQPRMYAYLSSFSVCSSYSSSFFIFLYFSMVLLLLFSFWIFHEYFTHFNVYLVKRDSPIQHIISISLSIIGACISAALVGSASVLGTSCGSGCRLLLLLW